jgi:hypothetical protein
MTQQEVTKAHSLSQSKNGVLVFRIVIKLSTANGTVLTNDSTSLFTYIFESVEHPKVGCGNY